MSRRSKNSNPLWAGETQDEKARRDQGEVPHPLPSRSTGSANGHGEEIWSSGAGGWDEPEEGAGGDHESSSA
jgi:hypothetical protein